MFIYNTDNIISQELSINQIENILINSRENIDDPDLSIVKYNFELYSIKQDSSFVNVNNSYGLAHYFTYTYKEINGNAYNAMNWIYYLFSYVDLENRWYQFPTLKYYTVYDNYMKIKMNLEKNGYNQIDVKLLNDKIIYKYQKTKNTKTKDKNGKVLFTDKKIIYLNIEVQQKNPSSTGVMLNFEMEQQ